MKKVWGFMQVILLILFLGSARQVGAQEAVPQETLDKLEKQYSEIGVRLNRFLSRTTGDYKPANKQAELDACHDGLKKLYEQGRAPLVELADLWALQWSVPHILMHVKKGEDGLEARADKELLMKYGSDCGFKADWSSVEMGNYLQDHPESEAMLAAEKLQDLYSTFGKRSPYALQGYKFKLRPFLNGETAQGAWDDVAVTNKETRKTNFTGFYAKQLLLGRPDQLFGTAARMGMGKGNRSQEYEIVQPGILYWLWVSDDKEGIKDALAVWRNQAKWVWNNDKKIPVSTQEPGQYEIKKEDIKYPMSEGEFLEVVKGIIDGSGQAPASQAAATPVISQ